MCQLHLVSGAGSASNTTGRCGQDNAATRLLNMVSITHSFIGDTHCSTTLWPSVLVSLTSQGSSGRRLASHAAPKLLDMPLQALTPACGRWLETRDGQHWVIVEGGNCSGEACLHELEFTGWQGFGG